MARLDLPPGDGAEIERVWALRPEMGKALQDLSIAVYANSILSPRVREAARMRVAEINDCLVCQRWRVPELADHGVTEELYAHVSEYATHEEYSEAERLAIEYAERFALNHKSIDDEFFDRLRTQFTDPEILDLSICVGNWVAFGRVTMLLDLDEACGVRHRTQ